MTNPEPHEHHHRSRTAAAGLLGAVAVLVVAGCGLGGAAAPAPGAARLDAVRLDAVRITGTVGTAPGIDWTSRMTASGIETETLVEGSGSALVRGQSVLAQVWIGDGTTQDQAYSSYDEGTAQLLTTGESDVPAIGEALSGARIGSRVVVTASGAEAFGSAAGRPELGLAGQDGVLVVLDLLSTVASGPTGVQAPVLPQAPTVVQASDGKPERLDLSPTPQPVGKFQKAVLVVGGGKRVDKDSTVAIRYLGQRYGAEEPFADDYDAARPTTFRIGDGTVIDAWDKMVRGTTVGSRILVEAPPKLGYGSAGRPDVGITSTDTLFYVIDVLGAT